MKIKYALINQRNYIEQQKEKHLKEANDLLLQQNKLKEEELKTKDRVDLSLNEYNRLIEENKQLKLEINSLLEFFKKLKIPFEILNSLDMDSVEVCTYDNARAMTQSYRIQFDISTLGRKIYNGYNKTR